MRVELNKANIELFLKGPEVQALLLVEAAKIAGKAVALSPPATTKEHLKQGPAEYKASVNVGRSRALGSVVTDNTRARVDQAYHNTLREALGEGMI